VTEAGADSFWETAEAVERFTGKQPDVRLLELLQGYPEPGNVLVLDVGCAAGRNTLILAERGFDVFAIDSSIPMVGRTRERVARVLGPEEAERRVTPGRMEDLRRFEDASVQMLVALGVLHQATSETQWNGAIGEMSRCVAPGGVLLVAAWSPRSRPHGESIRRVPGGRHLYEGFHTGTHYLVEAPELDSSLAAAGFTPAVPTEEVRVETENGWRVTINALYRRVQS
jgi:SAM-dependent methyltransferase